MDNIIAELKDNYIQRMTSFPQLATQMDEENDKNVIHGDLEEGFVELDVVLIEQARDEMVKRGK